MTHLSEILLSSLSPIRDFCPARPSIVTRIVRDRNGQMREIYEDRTRYPGHVLREIRRDGTHR